MKATVHLKQDETLRRFTISRTSFSIANLICSLIHSLTSSFINLFKESFTPLSNFWLSMLLAPILSHLAAQEFTLNHQSTNTLCHMLHSWYRAAANQEIIIEPLKNSLFLENPNIYHCFHRCNNTVTCQTLRLCFQMEWEPIITRFFMLKFTSCLYCKNYLKDCYWRTTWWLVWRQTTLHCADLLMLSCTSWRNTLHCIW